MQGSTSRQLSHERFIPLVFHTHLLSPEQQSGIHCSKRAHAVHPGWAFPFHPAACVWLEVAVQHSCIAAVQLYVSSSQRDSAPGIRQFHKIQAVLVRKYVLLK